MKIVAFILTLVFLTAPVWAAKDNREKQLLRRAQQQIQQAEQARVQAEQDKASLLAEKETLIRQYGQAQTQVVDARRQARAAKIERARLVSDLGALRFELDENKKLLEITRKQLSDSQLIQRITAQKLALIESDTKLRHSELLQSGKALQVCHEHNGRLYQLGRELINRYAYKSCKDAFLQNEPFTGLKKVEMENLLEQWRDKLDREKLDK